MLCSTNIAFILVLVLVILPSAVHGKRSFARPKTIERDREVLTVHYRNLTVKLEGKEICSTGCANPNPDGETYPQALLAACKLHKKCIELSSDPNIHAMFPNLDEAWCDDAIEEFGAQICLKADGNDGHLVMAKLENVVQIVSSKSTEGWQSCHLQGHETCSRCLSADHRGGIKDYFVTSYACAWHGDHCDSADVGGPTVTDRADCHLPPGSSVAVDFKLDGDAHGGGLAQLQVSSNANLSRSSRTVGKRALLVAYGYPGTKNSLGGTIPDIVRVFKHLTEDRGFGKSEITVLLDDQRYIRQGHFQGANLHLARRGSRTELLGKLQETLDDLNAGDFFVFHYSGHGFFLRDVEGDELDGLDEVICLPNGEHLRDDDFYKELARIPKGVAVTAIVDACHCEGFSDLPFNYMLSSRSWCTDWTGTYKQGPRSFPQATITFISGSQNHQTSTDLGDAGALSMHAINYWTRPTVFYEALAGISTSFQKRGIKQRPNVAAWPSFRDTGKFSPWNPANAVAADGFLIRDHAIGGPVPNPNDRHPRAVVPKICTHGYTSSDGSSHKRIKRAADEFIFDDKLTEADNGLSPGQLPTEGWFTGSSQSVKPTPAPQKPAYHTNVTESPDKVDAGVASVRRRSSDASFDSVRRRSSDASFASDRRRSSVSGQGLKKIVITPIRGKSGFRMMPSDGYVDMVKYDGAAYRAGLREGQKVIALNGKDALKLSENGRRAIMSRPQYELTVCCF